jgi:dipeptidyl aminopeptidase/acylaminoacyl peptidase
MWDIELRSFMHTAIEKRSSGLAALFMLLGALAGTAPAQTADAQSPAPPVVRMNPPARATTAADSLRPASQQRRGPGESQVRGVYKSRITPHWFQDNTRFWYRNDLLGGTKEFIMVDAERATRQPAFDHQKLAAALSKVAGDEYKADRLPFTDIEFIEDGKAIRFDAASKTWKCDLNSYECSALAGNSDSKSSKAPAVLLPSPLLQKPLLTLMESRQNAGSPPAVEADAPLADTPATPSPQQQAQEQQGQDQAQSRGRGQRQGSGPSERPGDPARSLRSPDDKWTAFVKDQNVYVRSEDDAKEYQLSQDGQEGNAYGRLAWAPDSKVLVAWRIEPGDRKEVYLIQSSPPGGGRAILRTRPYPLPGDKFTRYELNLFDVTSQKQTKPEVDRFEHEWEPPRLRWNRDNFHFTYEQIDRGHQRFRVIEVNGSTGAVRNLVDEKTETFIWTAHTENLSLKYVNWLEKTDEMIYASERDGWRHLYLIDTKEGKIKHPITQGEYVVRGIDRIDEDTRQVWFRAGGKNPDQDPYLIHFYRVNFDGTGLVALTESNGNHTIAYSPDRKYIIDTYSRVDMPSAHELRRVSDGKWVCKLEEADITELKASGWMPTEVFVANGRDGKTDIWGIICRPRNFDPSKKYPVIEQIYAGPQGSFVPKTFSGSSRFSSLTDLGFIVVHIDGMGTANRSKAFHDVCWKNLKDAGFPDRILWHQAVAAKYPYYDITRLGISGTSAGAQNSAGALLFYPEFYKAAVAGCGCHDNRMDKASWNEQWMGYPVGPQYAECSNIENAHRLRGKLLLIVGEMDNNVPPESTMRFADALIKTGKDFDLVVVPGAGHGMGGNYGQRRMQDFFVRHLLGANPPDRNAPATQAN